MLAQRILTSFCGDYRVPREEVGSRQGRRLSESREAVQAQCPPRQRANILSRVYLRRLILLLDESGIAVRMPCQTQNSLATSAKLRSNGAHG